MSVPTAAKWATDSFTSGGSTLMPGCARVGEVDGHLVLVVTDRGQQRGHVLGREVRLEVGRPVGDKAVPGGVRLVERVAGERQHDVPQRLDRLVGVPACRACRLELIELLVQDLLLLLTHGAAQQVGAAERVAGQLPRDGHDLLLVDEQVERGTEDRLERFFELRMDRRDLLPAVLAVRVVGVRVRGHRARPVERENGGDVLEPGRFHQLEQVPHRAAVELEDAQRVAPGQQFIGRGVVERDASRSSISMPRLALMILHGVVDDAAGSAGRGSPS